MSCKTRWVFKFRVARYQALLITVFSFQEENTEAESDDEHEKEDGNSGNGGKMMFSLLHDDEFSIREKKGFS